MDVQVCLWNYLRGGGHSERVPSLRHRPEAGTKTVIKGAWRQAQPRLRAQEGTPRLVIVGSANFMEFMKLKKHTSIDPLKYES